VETTEPILALLERIAVALETIAGNQIKTHVTKKTRTLFPWNLVSAVCRNAMRRAILNPNPRHQPREWGEYKWPLCCEELNEIGFSNLEGIRNLGPKSRQELASVMTKIGWPDWMMT
jgi:hypothetical protein